MTNNQRRVLTVLNMVNGPTLIGQIMERASLTEPMVRRDLDTLATLALCVPCGYGLYRITEAGKDAAKGKAA